MATARSPISAPGGAEHRSDDRLFRRPDRADGRAAATASWSPPMTRRRRWPRRTRLYQLSRRMPMPAATGRKISPTPPTTSRPRISAAPPSTISPPWSPIRATFWARARWTAPTPTRRADGDRQLRDRASPRPPTSHADQSSSRLRCRQAIGQYAWQRPKRPTDRRSARRRMSGRCRAFPFTPSANFPIPARRLQRAGADRRLSKAHLTVQLGGIDAAVEHYHGQVTPNLLIVETRLKARPRWTNSTAWPRSAIPPPR